MIKITVLAVGKTKESWVSEACKEYRIRLNKWANVTEKYTKNNLQLEELTKTEPGCICLDPEGKTYDSKEFACFLEESWIAAGARLTLIIGGPEGLPETLKKRFPCISLSALTFTHQVVRVILFEQLYRAFTILNHLPYHR
ncbi:MAG: 23S rRNA (pseudouridine(1915)-N(3))-methyltransferase RlmH [Chlamydiales bacterium]